MKLDNFLQLHKPQLESSGVPQHLWESLLHKVRNEIFDAGDVFQLMLIDYDEDEEEQRESEFHPVYTLVAGENGLNAADATAIYLIDHAWTFRANDASKQLAEDKSLLARMCNVMGISETSENCLKDVLQRLWCYCQTYSLATNTQLDAESRLPVWYVMDEVGLAVNHADEPNSRIVPFLNLETGITYSLLFPICNIAAAEPISRDFVEQVPASEQLMRQALLLPWQYYDFRDISAVQTEPPAEYFTQGHIAEHYTNTQTILNLNKLLLPLRVYTTYDVLRNALTAAEFLLVDDAEQADVLWLHEHFKDFDKLASETPHKFINQFPFEHVITVKDLLAIVSRRQRNDSAETHNWLPTTYNLKTELIKFISYYQQRAASGADNHWIVKPWNLARALDQTITNNINQIVRLSTTSPKIVQKYLHNPVLFQRNDINAAVKFDVRYVFVVKSVAPLEAYIYKNFFLRFANHAFALTDFDDYEKHFTVMNYRNDNSLYHLKAEEFLQQHWSKQYAKHAWADIEADIVEMLRNVLKCATQEPAPRGIAANAQSRALYAADIMLEWEKNVETGEDCMQPKLLEINFAPDCNRACVYYPEFFNDVFKLLFLDELNNETFKAIH